MLTKKEARQRVFKKRKQHTSDEIEALNDSLRHRLSSLEQYKNAEIIFSYISYNKEPDTIEIIKALLKKGIKVAVPSTTFPGASMREMKFFLIDNLDTLVITERGIYEPDFTDGNTFCEVTPNENDLVIMPGVAFDINLNRAGYGGGFYDTWLKKVLQSSLETNCKCENKVCCVALAFEFQVFDKIESEKHDIKPDMIITEKRIIK